MPFERGFQSRQSTLVDTAQQFLRCRCGENLIEENLQRRVGYHFQSQRRLAHFTDASAECCYMFRAKMRVKTEGHFQFVNGFGREPRNENLVQPLEGVMIALQPCD